MNHKSIAGDHYIAVPMAALFYSVESILNGHPDPLLPEVQVATGPLGEGVAWDGRPKAIVCSSKYKITLSWAVYEQELTLQMPRGCAKGPGL